MDVETISAIRRALAADRRPWRPLSDFFDAGDDLVEITFPNSSSTVVQLTETAEELGFKAEARQIVALSRDVGDVVLLALKVVGDLGIAARAALGIAQLPDTLAKLRAKLGPYLGRAMYASPVLYLEPAGRWFDSKFGKDRWRLDPDRMTTYRIQETTLFRVYEMSTKTWYVLAVVGDEVTELPKDILPGGGDSGS